MIASAHNGYQTTNPNTCAGTNFRLFHPQFDTAKFGNFVSWAALQANVNFAMEIGHFVVGRNGDNDSDDAPCFPGPTVPGCLGADADFDGTSYLFDWPDGTPNNATSIEIQSVKGGGIGPLSASDDAGNYDHPFPIIRLRLICQPLYPFFALATSGGGDNNGGGGNAVATNGDNNSQGGCTLLFGDFRGPNVNNFGRDAQYGASCIPNPGSSQN